MDEKHKINIDVFIGIALTVLSGFFFYETVKMHPVAARFPKVVFGLFIIMSVLLTILGIRKTLKPELALKSDFQLNLLVIRAPLAVFGIICGYMVLMYFTGFFISTLVFIPVFMIYYGVKSIRTIVLTNVFLNLFVYLVFVKLLKVVMP